MFPNITILGRTFAVYSIITAFATLLIGFILCSRIKRLGLDSNDAILFLLSVMGGILVGSHFLFAITNFRLVPNIFSSGTLDEFFRNVAAVFGGAVFYGGLIGGLVAGWIFARIMKLDMLIYCDTMAPLIPLFHGFARLGCFFGGCCYGIESDIGFVVHNNIYLPELNGVRRFPVQLFESAGEFLIFLILNLVYIKIWRSRLRDETTNVPLHPLRGCLLSMYFILYSVLRFSDEFLRGDTIRGFVFNGLLSTSQFISILVFVVGVVYFVITYKKNIRSTP
ncbi:MAG: prolipoprotein diacylglyceryl transferase [Oscillospiraceae bacterium]|nr:prolipoprotein diacylglyceryl transferase [Oscillospiraceae bacterium]